MVLDPQLLNILFFFIKASVGIISIVIILWMLYNLVTKQFTKKRSFQYGFIMSCLIIFAIMLYSIPGPKLKLESGIKYSEQKIDTIKPFDSGLTTPAQREDQMRSLDNTTKQRTSK